MKRFLLPATLFALLAAPAGARQAPPTGPGPSAAPEMRARMSEARSAARSSAMSALSGDHRSAVDAIVDQVKSGDLSDPRDAAHKIDAILSPKERAAVLAARDTMFGALGKGGPPGGEAPDRGRADAPPPGDGPPPDGAPPDGGPPRPAPDNHLGGMREHGPGGRSGMRDDAGFALLVLSLDREQMRALFMRGRDGR